MRKGNFSCQTKKKFESVTLTIKNKLVKNTFCSKNGFCLNNYLNFCKMAVIYYLQNNSVAFVKGIENTNSFFHFIRKNY